VLESSALEVAVDKGRRFKKRKEDAGHAPSAKEVNAGGC
jgi:hypothetical protein